MVFTAPLLLSTPPSTWWTTSATICLIDARGVSLTESFLATEFYALLQVLFIDIVLAGDNAVVVGMAAAGADPSIRCKVIFWAIGGAVVLPVLFDLGAAAPLAISALPLPGGTMPRWA